jgi:endonuclease/exonuclease/phosphatase family metal-dependent hydrolase
MQEAMPEFWSSRLFAKLGADYGIVRNEGNPKMEYNPLLWRKSRLELIEGGTHVYADNPEGSKGFGWGVFRDKATGRTFIAYSTHLWWKWKKPEDSEMRVRNARELLAKMDELQVKHNCPVVGGGDLNSTRAQMERGFVTPLPDWEKAGFADAQYAVKGASDYSSHHGDPRRDALGNYRGWISPEAGDPKNSLDHVHYTTNGVTPISLVVDRAQDALEVSDHSPVNFTFRLGN